MSESTPITGVFRNGHVELESSVDWAEGARVAIVPLAHVPAPLPRNGQAEEPLWGMEEAEYQDTPEFRARLIAHVNSFQPLELTPEEEAEWRAGRSWIKEHTIAAVRAQMGL